MSRASGDHHRWRTARARREDEGRAGAGVAGCSNGGWGDVAHVIGLYVSAAVVVGVGLRTLVLVAGSPTDGGRPGEVVAVVRAAWSPRPWVTAALFAVMAVMAAAQCVVPSVIGALERRPGALTEGQWWRAGTALLVQSSGWTQIAMNLSALVVVGAVAESVLGHGWTLAVFLVSGATAHAVSLAGWSPSGGGDSVAICGLLGALAVGCVLRVRWQTSWFVLLIPACGLFLLLQRNNHGVGLVAGCLLGLVCATRPLIGRPARRVPAEPLVTQPTAVRKKRSVTPGS